MNEHEPKVSVVVPTHNSAQFIQDTCESLLAQKEISWEAIFVDAGSDDRTVEIIHSFKESRFRVQILLGGSIFALNNRAIMIAKGKYIHLLLEGCTYLSPIALSSAFQKIEELNYPDIFYTASYVGDTAGAMHLYFLQEPLSMLQEGLQPSLLQACFIQRALFKKIGYFRTDLLRRSALDFFCRAAAVADVKIASQKRVYVELGRYPQHLLQTLILYKETWKVIYTYFGLKQATRWASHSRRRKKFLGIVLSEA